MIKSLDFFVSTFHKTKKVLIAVLSAFIVSIISTSVYAQDNSSNLKFSTGFDYSSGSYGLSSDTDIMYIPFSVKYETFPWKLKLTVPYVRITGPGGVVAGADGPIVIGESTTRRTTEEGLGDVVVYASYSLDSVFKSSLLIDLLGKVKIGTADETKGLGTGENDFSMQMDIAKKIDGLTPFATVGHKVTGDSEELKLKDIWYSSLGVDYKINSALSSGLSFDYKQATTTSSEDSREGIAYLNWKLNSISSIMGYATTGFSDGSPESGLGVQMTLKY